MFTTADQWALVVSIILTISFLFYRWYKKQFDYWRQYPMIPSVPGRIFGGNFKDIVTFKTNFGFRMKTIYDSAEFQNEAVVGIYTLQPALLIRDPELLKSIMIRDFDCFHNRFSQCDIHHDPIGSSSLFMARYDLWRELRTKLSPIFTSGKLKQMYPLIQQVGENLEQYLQKQGERFVCEFKNVSYLYTIDTIATTTFGISSNSLENPEEEVNLKSRQLANFNVKRALNFLIISMIPSLNGIFKTRAFFKETEEFARSTTEYVIKERESSGIKRNDMIDIFLKLKDEAVAKGTNRKEYMDLIAAQMATFMGGGTETSSATIANLFLEIAKQPTIQDRLREEIVQAFVKGNGCISYEEINDLKYLSMVIDETLRMYPVLPLIERQFQKPNNKCENYSLSPYYDFKIPEGMAVYISVYGLHYDTKYWSEPLKFDPQRFTPENKKSLNPMIYMPFGDGPRNCIGARLGNLQIKACIVHILKNHYVRVCPKTNVKTEFNPRAFFLQTIGGIHLEVIKDDLYNRFE